MAIMTLDENDVALVFTSFEGYQFLTCYAEPYISFDFYLTPYQTEAWVVLGVSISTIIGVMTIAYHFLYKKDKQPFSAWLFVLASLFEEGGFLPSKLEKTTFCRILIGIWSIMSVILTNGYNGIMISELNSPRRFYHPEKFDDLACQDQINGMLKSWHRDKTRISKSDWRHYENLTQFADWVHRISMGSGVDLKYRNGYSNYLMSNVDDKCYKLLSPFQRNSLMQALPEFLSILGALGNDFQYSWMWYDNGATLEIFRNLNLFTPMHSFYPNDVSFFNENFSLGVLQGNIEKEVVQCGKTVFIAKSSELQIEKEFLARKYPRKKFVVSDQVVQTYPSGIAFQFPLRSPIIKSFKGVVEAGIWVHVEGEELQAKNFNRTQAVVMRQSNNIVLTNIATLNGALPTVFILAGSLICAAMVAFIKERQLYIILLMGLTLSQNRYASFTPSLLEITA
ncbi:hypothetical protein Fcan01_15660 [Folsomia candida]|uniref:Uncharacterized protein n=1 Tax=Folsomia candida TaxID=158441 RepID=A0A226DWJ7_FOLCA|nr:hypothetical protein Fcan01_15660 [Folsomia candida]